MSRSRLCLGTAVIAAAIADPAVELASNAGWFGPGHFTDRSNLDVVPSLLIGIGLLALYLVTKAGSLVADRSLARGILRRLPAIFGLQILALFIMETLEQVGVYGHLLGPAIWLGGPLPASLMIHAAVCIVVTYAIARSARGLAVTTLRVIRLIRAIGTFAVRTAGVTACYRPQPIWFKELLRALRRVGERAPPREPVTS
ncbi:MAG: hypothetical protein WAK16_02800 [Candidatus Cybelea sp.]